MTIILFLNEASYCNMFRGNYLSNEKYFLNFFSQFRNLHSILNIFKKTDDPHSWCIFQFMGSKTRG